MCTSLSTAMSVVTLAMGVAQEVSANQASKNEAEVRRQEAKNTAKLQEYQAQLYENKKIELEAEKNSEEKKIRQNMQREAGYTRSLLAASGVTLDSGSALDALLDGQEAGAREIATLQHKTSSQQQDLQNKADLTRYNASQYKGKNFYTGKSPLEQGMSYASSASRMSSLLTGGR